MQQVISKRNSTPLLAGAGVLLGILAFVTSPVKAAAVVAGLFICALVLWRVELGIYLAVGLLPLLPTTGVLGLMALTVISFSLRMFFDKTIRIRLSALDLFVIGFALVMLFTSLTSYKPKSSILAFVIMAVLIAFYFVVTNTIKTRQQLFLLILVIVITSFFVSMFGIYQYKTGGLSADSWVDQEMFSDIKTRVTGTFDNPNVFGEYLVLIIPMAVSLLYARKDWFFKLTTLIILGVMAVCLQLTYSRGAMLGLILAAFLFVLFRDRRLFLLGIPAVAMAPFIVPMSIINRLSSIGNTADSSTLYRISVWLGSLRIAKEYWMSGIGSGADAFALVYPRYSFNAAYAKHSHNVFIQLTLENGIFGLLLILLLVLAFYKLILKSYKKAEDGFDSAFMIASAAGLTGYLFQGLVDNIWYNNRVLAMFWIVIALGTCAARLVEKPKEDGVVKS